MTAEEERAKVVAEYPLFHCWLHRDPFRGRGWCFGFFLAPWPRSEHQVGDMVRALVVLDGFFDLSRREFGAWWRFADPADRALDHHTTGATDE